MFFATGNGYASQLSNIPVPGRQPPTALEEAVVHMSIAADGSLGVVDFCELRPANLRLTSLLTTLC